MKVLRDPRNLNKKWSMKVVCHDCGAALQAQASDFRYEVDQRDGDALVCKCPICKSDIWIDAGKFPEHVRAAARR